MMKVLIFATMVVFTFVIGAPWIFELLQIRFSFFDKPKTNTRHKIKRQTPGQDMIGDESQLPYEVRSSSLPLLHDRVTINSRYMPTLGNGHIAVTVYDDAMYMNGLYEGTGENSHRAKIPVVLMGRVNFSSIEIDKRAIRKYTLNSRDGYFLETIDCEFAYIEHRIYTHQKYIRLFVSDFYARRKPESRSGGVIELRYPSLNVSSDILFDQVREYYSNKQVKGTTKTAEAGASPQNVFMFFMEPVRQISLTGSSWDINVTMVLSVDKSEANARSELDAAQNILGQRDEMLGNYKFFIEHIEAWRNIWNQGGIEVYGDIQLAKVTQFSQYYLLSSLPVENPFLPIQYSEVYYGCSRTGLAKGGAGKDYQGHILWDNEMYIIPAILPFYPNIVKKMLRYRSAMSKRAADNAKRFGASGGYHFPWESAFSGNDLSPSTCEANQQNCHWKKLFVTAGVSWAIRQYYSSTKDRDFIINADYSGCDITREIARFLSERAVYNQQTARYDILNITGADDWHPNVNNNAFTLASMSLAIHWARYFACLCQRNEREEVPDEWIQKALHLNLPFDNVKRLHYQHHGFDPVKDRPIKQADTIMLTYPLNWNVSIDIQKNDLEMYETLTNDGSPALTWSWFTIGWKWVNDKNRMNSYFLKSYQDYLIQPFKIWTEFNEVSTSDQLTGNVNFLPGMGGFIQSLIYGFAGIRIRPDILEFHSPIPPPGSTKMVLNGLKYLGSVLTFVIEQDITTVYVNSSSSSYPLILKLNKTLAVEESLLQGETIVVTKSSDGFFIYTSVSETCEHPRDFIYMPWGYSPFINSASRDSSTFFSFNMIVIIFSFVT